MEQEILPLGSVVLLKGGRKKIMIIGYRMRTQERPNQIYDYCGCVFPEGVLRSDITCVFNHEQIDQIFFSGYKNEESNSFITKIEEKTKEEQTPSSNQQPLPLETLETE